MRLSPMDFNHRLAILFTIADIAILSLAMVVSLPPLR